MLRWFPLVFFIACAALLGSLLLAEKETLSSPFIGKEMPERPVSAGLYQDRAPEDARIILYNVFASWCAPCAAEMPLLKELQDMEAVEVMGIAWSDKHQKIETFLTQNGNPFSSIFDDAKGEWGIALGIRGVPETFVVDQSGTVRMHISGELKKTDVKKIAALAQGEVAP